AQSGKLLRTLPQGGAVLALAYRQDGKLLAAATEAGAVHFWDPDTGQSGPAALRLKAAVYHVAFSRDGRLLVTADAGHIARVWEVATGKPVTEPLEHRDHRTEVEFAIAYRCWPLLSPDGSAVVTVSPNQGNRGIVSVWDLATGKRRYTVECGYFVH